MTGADDTARAERDAVETARLEQAIRHRLDEIGDPCSVGHGSPMGLAELGLVESIAITAERVAIRLRLTSPSCMVGGYFREQIAGRLRDVVGDREIRMSHDLGLDWEAVMIAPEAARGRGATLEAPGA